MPNRAMKPTAAANGTLKEISIASRESALRRRRVREHSRPQNFGRVWIVANLATFFPEPRSPISGRHRGLATMKSMRGVYHQAGSARDEIRALLRIASQNVVENRKVS
jgi:hypothetical protein